MKLNPKYIYLLIITILVVIIALIKACNHVPDIGKMVPNHDSIYKSEQKENAIIQTTLKEIKILKAKNDSLEKLKPKVVHHYHTVYDSLKTADTSSIGSLITLYNAFGELNDLNDTIIINSKRRAEKDSILITSGNNKLAAKQHRITTDSTYINYLLYDSIPKVKRKSFVKGFKWGFGTGAVVTEGVNIGAKIKP